MNIMTHGLLPTPVAKTLVGWPRVERNKLKGWFIKHLWAHSFVNWLLSKSTLHKHHKEFIRLKHDCSGWNLNTKRLQNDCFGLNLHPTPQKITSKQTARQYVQQEIKNETQKECDKRGRQPHSLLHLWNILCFSQRVIFPHDLQTGFISCFL